MTDTQRYVETNNDAQKAVVNHWARLDKDCLRFPVRNPQRAESSVTMERVKELRVSGMGASAIAKEMGIVRASVYGDWVRSSLFNLYTVLKRRVTR
jgi:hypothetical protein